ncbi:LITAF-like zinc ribbon domain-containing protein, partial [Mycotypha africana]|uniref:LITAF-like zinc ribbon domain-containing protein n=1 Tax=Mycotypha africana TaxID=64632 RepID=UPI00230056A1
APPIINNHSNITIEPVTALKTSSKLVQCPHCQQIGYTKLVHGYGACTGVSFASLLFLGCSPITFLIPFFFPWFQDVIHRCPSCNEEIAKFTKLDRRLQVNS